MQYDVQKPDEYLENLPDDWRKNTLKEIRALILKHGPNLKEIIQYKMLGYTLANDTVFNLNAQKNYVSLYVGNHEKIDPTGVMLRGLNLGKGCIRFSKSKKPTDTQIEKFIQKTVQLTKEGKDVGC